MQAAWLGLRRLWFGSLARFPYLARNTVEYRAASQPGSRRGSRRCPLRRASPSSSSSPYGGVWLPEALHFDSGFTGNCSRALADNLAQLTHGLKLFGGFPNPSRHPRCPRRCRPAQIVGNSWSQPYPAPAGHFLLGIATRLAVLCVRLILALLIFALRLLPLVSGGFVGLSGLVLISRPSGPPPYRPCRASRTCYC